jgi:uncharacterized circularly permuted ATP-grasp superfamily protein/uncharacterized alpha-E superfamily protein
MVNGQGGLRPHWRALIGAFAALGEGGLTERARRLDRAFEDEGVASVLPGAEHAGRAWRCDPVPLPLPAGEFGALAAGLAQRARLLEALLGDIYGAQSLLADGALPPGLVFANPAFLRACRTSTATPVPRAGNLMQFYAADLIRGPDGGWRVLADRTAGAAGIGYARENRRLLARVMPEPFRPVQVQQLRPFFDIWQEALTRIAPPAAVGNRSPAVALLTPGTGHPLWFEHMYLSRELSCALVEGGDLTVRGGAVMLKTLKGLQPVDVLLRRLDGRMMDPLELAPGSLLGVPGLMDAMRNGSVRVTNDPGTGVLEAPALAAYLPTLCMRLLGEPLKLASVPTMWLGEPRARELVLAEPDRWLIRPATDGRAPARRLQDLPPAERAEMLRNIAAHPEGYAASAALAPSLAPCAGARGEGLEARPIQLRLFLVHDGAEWQAMRGGLARVVQDGLAGQLPHQALSKDVWVLSEDGTDIVGPQAMMVPPLAIRRTAGELPSRVADNMFWLGRYIERLEGGARLCRTALARLGRGQPLPREIAELEILGRCMIGAELMPAEATVSATASTAPMAQALLAGMREHGPMARQFANVGRLTDVVRDRLTGEMYAAFVHALRLAREAATGARDLDALSAAMTEVLRFAATVSGVAAENMVRAGGWIFLDLGRRVERAQAVAAQVAFALDQPVRRIEIGLRLILELCDSVITYRSRYLNVLQPAPVLDLVLADEGNPRGLAFQIVGIRTLLGEVAAHTDDTLTGGADILLREAQALVQSVLAGPDQAAAAAHLPPRLEALGQAVASLSDRLTRRYFALLPAVQTLGMEAETPSLLGAA